MEKIYKSTRSKNHGSRSRSNDRVLSPGRKRGRSKERQLSRDEFVERSPSRRKSTERAIDSDRFLIIINLFVTILNVFVTIVTSNFRISISKLK